MVTPSKNLIPRPVMPTAADESRSIHQRARWSVLEEDFDQLLEEWLEQHIDSERLSVWGIPDTSVNPLADMSRQLTTPGLYGVRPAVLHPDPMGSALVGPGGFMDQAGIWTKLQQVQYYAVGMGDYWFRLGVNAEDRRLTARLVSPHNLYVGCREDDPDRPVKIWELRERWHSESNAWIWTWDVCDISDPDFPVFMVVGAGTVSGRLDGVDLSAVFLGTDENPEGDFKGPNYPWRDLEGAYLPWARYTPIDTGKPHNWEAKRGAYRGTLNAALNWSYAQHAARDASGTTTFAYGFKNLATTTKHGIQGIKATPGCLHLLQVDPDYNGQPGFHESGPGAVIESVAAYATLYEQKQAVRWGLNPSDVSKTNNTTTSGAALFVSNQGRRDFAARVRPMFRKSDLNTISICARLLTGAAVGDFPSVGYSVTYAPIPKSPAEEKEERETLDWEKANGAITATQIVMKRRPGISEDQAFALIVAQRVEEQQIKAATEAELARLGLLNEPDSDEIDETPAADGSSQTIED